MLQSPAAVIPPIEDAVRIDVVMATRSKFEQDDRAEVRDLFVLFGAVVSSRTVESRGTICSVLG